MLNFWNFPYYMDHPPKVRDDGDLNICNDLRSNKATPWRAASQGLSDAPRKRPVGTEINPTLWLWAYYRTFVI